MSSPPPLVDDRSASGSPWAGRPRRPTTSIWFVAVIKDFALAGMLCLCVLVFLFQPFRVEGVSMEPQFADRDRVIVNKASYRVGQIQQGDVVVFWFPEDARKSFIKRVIGLPGDRVEIRAGTVFVNGAGIPEPYLDQPTRLHEDLPEVTVRRGYYYVLGDRRDRSFDSRVWGLVPERYIYGKVILSYWPPDRIGFIAD